MRMGSTFRIHPQETPGIGHGDTGGHRNICFNAGKVFDIVPGDEGPLYPKGSFAVMVMIVMVIITTSGLGRTSRKTSHPSIKKQ